MEEGDNYKKIHGKRAYLDLFEGDSVAADSKKAKALDAILDIRKFEIELFWKRTTFFWTTNAAIIAGYFVSFPKEGELEISRLKILFSLGCLGLLFAVAWYLANRGSKFWQQNWEKHLDCMEDEVIGPLYKTTLITGHYRKNIFERRKLLSAYPISVSRITVYLSLVLVAFWILLLGDLLWNNVSFLPCSWKGVSTFCLGVGVFTLFAIIMMYKSTNTGFEYYKKGMADPREATEINFEKRGFK